MSDPDRLHQLVDEMLQEWRELTAPELPLADWEAHLEVMANEMSHLRSMGLWRSGRMTLLAELGLHHNEVLLCRAIAWLLRPDGSHGLGSAFVDGLLDELGLPLSAGSKLGVITEELRNQTRADIVLRYTDTCVLIEAKVFAVEQVDQADRLERYWEDESPVLVFLTRDGRRPHTAGSRADEWRSLTWRRVARLLRAAIAEEPACEPGAVEVARTLEIYGGGNG